MRLLETGALILFPALAWAEGAAPPVKRLPGNKPCPYPAEAQKSFVAGPVLFTARVLPDGNVAGVDVRKVPLPGLGFEDGIRVCVSEWRFEAAPAGHASLRSYEGTLRYRLDAAEEPAIRARLDDLASAWNAGDSAAVEELALKRDDTPALSEETRRPLREQLDGEQPAPPWRIELEADVQHLRFLRPDLVTLRQPYRRTSAAEGGTPEAAALDAILAKGTRGWRFVKLSSFATAWLEAVHVGHEIKEPRKVKNVAPRYPEYLKEARVQGVVILECVISPEGKVTNVRLLRGVQKGLDDAAIDAVRKWEYTPTFMDGKAVAVIMTVTVNFRLN